MTEFKKYASHKEVIRKIMKTANSFVAFGVLFNLGTRKRYSAMLSVSTLVLQYP